MATIMLSNRVNGKSKRLKIDGVNLKGNVVLLRSKVSSLINEEVDQIELVYCGRCLQDDEPLEQYGVKPGVTVHALRKRSLAGRGEQQPERMEKEAIDQVVTALQTALVNPAYRATLERMLEDPETLENIMAATPGLSTDPTAIAILQEPEMLAMLADPSHVNSVIEAHPALGHAAMLLAAAVNQEGLTGAQSGSNRGTYSLDQMSDDDDLEGPGQRGRGEGGPPITASQLAAALMAAGASDTAGPSTSSGNSSSGGSGGGGSGISADFFQQAMAHAASGGSQQSEEQIQQQLAQMRDMGIVDERVARQALVVTHGDMQAAIELIFGDSTMQ